MTIFWYHATFEESLELLRDAVARFGVRIAFPPPRAFPLPSAPPRESTEHEVVDAALARELAAYPRVALRIPSALVPSGDAERPLPASDAFEPHGLYFALADFVEPWGGRDAHLMCDMATTANRYVGLETALDDLVEHVMKRHLVPIRTEGHEHWVSPRVRDMAARGAPFIFDGPMPRRRWVSWDLLEYDREPSRMRYRRGVRPPAELRYERGDGTMLVTARGEGCDELYAELLAICGEGAARTQLRLTPQDALTRRVLAADTRFAAMRAPPPEREAQPQIVEVPYELARYCRDILFFGEDALTSPYARGERRGDEVHIAYWPAGRGCPIGAERVTEWTFDATAERLRRIGYRLEREIVVAETVWPKSTPP